MKISPKQMRLLRAIEGFNTLEQNPTQTELARVLRTSQANVAAMIRLLKEKKAISTGAKNSKRSIKLLIELD